MKRAPRPLTRHLVAVAAALVASALVQLSTAVPSMALLPVPNAVAVTLSKTLIPADGASTSTATALVTDATGQPVGGALVTWGVAANGPTVAAPASCTTATMTTGSSTTGECSVTLTSSANPGVYLVTAQSGGVSGSTHITQCGPAASATLSFAKNPIQAGGATTTATVSVLDSGSRPVTGAHVTLNHTGTAYTSFGTSTDNGDGTYAITVTSLTAVGTDTIDATATSSGQPTVTSPPVALTVSPGAPILSLAFSPNPITADGKSTTTATVTVADANNNRIAGDSVALVQDGSGSTADTSVGPIHDNGNGTYQAVVTASKTADKEPFHAVDSSPSTGPVSSPEVSLEEDAGPAATLALALNPMSITADGTSTAQATATLLDANHNGIVGKTGLALVPTATSNDTSISKTPVDNGDGTYTWTITASKTADQEGFRVTDTADGLTSSTATLTETPGPATALALNIAPAHVTADGTSTATATATLTDKNGNGVPGKAITLAHTGSGATADSKMSTVTDNRDGTYTWTITASTTADIEPFSATDTSDAGVQSASASMTEDPGPPTVHLSLSPSTVPVSGMGPSTSTATVTVIDGNGNAITGDTVAFASSGDDTFSPKASCVTDSTGTCPVTIKVSATPGQQTITATEANAGAAAHAVLTQYGAAAAVSLSAAPSYIHVVTGSSMVTATVTDQAGDPVPGVTVSFGSPTGGPIPTASPATCPTGTDGTCSLTFQASSTPGSFLVSGTSNGHGGTTTIVQFGAASSISLSIKPGSITADGTSTAVATATVKDSTGDGVPGDSNVAIKQTGQGPTNNDTTMSGVTDNGDGTYQWTIRASTTADTEPFQATDGVHTSNTANLIETPGPAVSVTLEITPGVVTANGTDTAAATVFVTDAHGNGVPGDTIVLNQLGSGPTADTGVGPVTDNGDGTYTFTLTASTTADIEPFTATDTTANKSSTEADLTELAGAAAGINLAFSKPSITANGSDTTVATATVTDQYGNLVKGETVTIDQTGSGRTADTTVGPVTDNGDGTYSATVTASKTADTEPFTASDSDAGISSSPENLVESPGKATTVALTFSKNPITANGTDTTTATATLTDANGNRVPGDAVTVNHGGSGITADTTVGAVKDNGDGTYTFTVTASKTADTEPFSATDTTATVSSPTVDLVEKPGPAAHVAVSLSRNPITANGSDATVATATVTDANGNRIAGDPVRFTTSGDDRVGAVADHGDGSYTTTVTASTTAGTQTITATDGAASGAAQLTQNSPAQPAPVRNGYWMLGSEGAVYNFGDAGFFDDASGFMVPDTQAVHIEPTPSGNGYWVLGDDGTVYAFGDAADLGSADLNDNETAASLSATPTGNGYWVFTSRGRAIPFGDAPFFGDMSAVALNGPVIDSVATPSGKGYWMVGSDGGIFSFGDAQFYGSMGGRPLNKPVVGLAPTPTGKGYWLVASDGGIFAFGDAQFHGSMGGKTLNKPVIGAVAYGNGYLMVASDGGIFDFSDKQFVGSLGANPPANPIVGVAVLR